MIDRLKILIDNAETQNHVKAKEILLAVANLPEYLQEYMLDLIVLLIKQGEEKQ